ncbi:MAG: hypothetical protein CMI01_13260, partial [Oceanospirillaceae bacterium]|nr:hypothetical protein [Oceanospirillaceae bacterium]
MNSSRLRHPLAQVVFIVLGGLTSISGHAMPTGAEVVHGQAVFNRIGQELRVENSRNAIIEWQDFSVELKESLRFVQPDELSAVLNRVVGSSPSEILGQISSNGRVFIVNPNGVIFGSESRIDVNGLIVSSLDIANDDFLEGRLKFEQRDAAGAVINEGQLVSGEDTSIVLIAPVIENSGLVRSENGDIILAAGNSVELVDSQNPEIRVQISAPAGEALNLGTLISNGGNIGIYAGVVNQSGVVSASSAVAEGGKIYLRGRQQAVIGSESVTQADGSKGGRVVITADAVEVKSDAKISAVGANDGGEVLVGGSWQNSDPDVPQAKTVNVESGAELNASASDNGDGGTVVVWSDTSDAGSQTQVRGQLKAQGGASGGNGGRIEASGNQLDIEGMTASTEAPVGRQGQVLLDPTNITIFTATSNINGDGVFGDDIDNVNALDEFTDFSGADSTITGQALANLLDNNDVTLAATNNINVSAAIIKSGTPSTTLRLEAGNEVNLSGSISSTGGPLNLEFAPGLLLADGLVDVNSSTIDLAGGTLEVIDGSGLLYLSVPDAASHLTLNSTANVKHLHINGGVLDGSGTLNVSDTFKWSSGDMVGTGRTVIQAGASGSFGDASSMYLREGRVLDNRGDVVQSSNSLLGQAPFGGVTGATSTPLIYNSGTWELSGGTSITEGTADTFGFINTGTVIKTGSGTTSTLMDMTNNGTVQVSVGRLLLDQSFGTGRTHSGRFELGGAGNLTFFGGGHSFADGSAFSGSGVFQRDAGATLSLIGSGSGLTIENGTGVDLALTNFQGTGNLTNRGQLTASAPLTFSGDILNTGVVTLTNDSAFNGIFNNQGTLNLNAGDANFASGLSVNGGTLNVSSGATLGGNVSLAGGILKGTGTLADDLIHTGGALRPGASPGTLTISGDYQMSPSATLQIEVGGTTAGNYDQLDISGTATLDGVLEIVHFGGFVPVPITLFSSIIDAAGGVSGSFSSLIEPSGHRYDVVYNGSTVDLSYGRLLTITANDVSRDYGDSNPAFSATYTGLFSGDSAGDITGLTFTTVANNLSPVGDYQLTPSGGTAPVYYQVTYADGTLAVVPRALTISADAQSKVYGDTLALGTNAFTASNLANGESVGSVTLTSLGGHDADTTSAVGTYTGDIRASNASGGTFDAGNYTLTYVDGDLSVTPRAATITADAQSKVYGDTLALGTSAFTASNLANGETVGSVTLTSLGGHDAGTTSAVGTYTGDIQASNASGGTFDAGNYILTYVDADLSVTPRDLTIAADAQSKVYGDTLALGTSAFTTSNLANGETVGSVTLTSLGGRDADTTSAVGTYIGDIQASNASGGTFDAGNYTLTYVDADLSVIPRAATITADAQSKVYGDTLALGTNAFTASNLVNGETVGSVTLTSLGGHDADTTSAVGTYMGDIQASNASGGTFDAGNYTLTYVDADLSV